MLAALADRHVPRDEPIDLINIAFGVHDINVPDRQTAINGLLELQSISNRDWRLIEVSADLHKLQQCKALILDRLCPSHVVMDFNIGAVMMLGARAKGRSRPSPSPAPVPLPSPLPSQSPSPLPSLSPRVSPSPLFADIIGRVRQDAYTEPIKSVHCRYAGLEDGDGEDTDLSAFVRNARYEMMTSRARVLLLGAGADEQLAGYLRHRTVYKHHGEEALRRELTKDLKRIWRRNLGISLKAPPSTSPISHPVPISIPISI